MKQSGAALAAFGVAALLVGCAAAPRSPVRTAADARADAARDFDLGVSAFGRGEYASALNYFTRANDTDPSPVALYDLARVHDAMGHAAEAARFYVQCLRHTPDVDPARVAEVRAALVRLAPRIAWVLVHAANEVQVDGVTVAPANRAYPVAIDPGIRAVIATGRPALAIRARAGETFVLDGGDAGAPLLVATAPAGALDVALSQSSEVDVALSGAGH